MNKTVLLFITLFIIGLGGTFFILKPNTTKQVNQALTHIKQGDAVSAEKILRSLSGTSHPYPDGLYMGYLEQARGRLDLSNSFFQTAFLDANRGTNFDLLSEITLAKASNAYLEKRDFEFVSLVESAAKWAPQTQAFQFFLGLQKYLSADYGEALNLWNQFSPDNLNRWAAYSLDNTFPPAWRKIHVAHCLIEEGDSLSGREILEREEGNFDSATQSLRPLSTLFLALSYIKEAHHIPLDKRDSYYKLVRFYMDRSKTGSGKHDPFSREKSRIIYHIEEEVKDLLLTDFNENKQRWGFDFIHVLNEWRAHDTIERLSEALAQKLLSNKGSDSNLLCENIRSEFRGTFFHVQLTEKILTALSQALKQGETEHLIDLWNLVEALAPNPKNSAREIASLTSDEIFENIRKDNLHLSRTRLYLAFWEKLGRSVQEREFLARDLLTHAKLFWHNEKQEKKGQRLMEIALKLSNCNPLVEHEIAIFLTKLYSQAEDSNMIRRLTLIYDAMECFDINRQELVSKATLANHLADAGYLYETHNFPAAKVHASWVLKFDPYNENAHRLAGLSSFNLGEYNRAFHHLRELKNPDEDSCKALMLSRAFASQEPERHLCQIDASDSFDENGDYSK